MKNYSINLIALLAAISLCSAPVSSLGPSVRNRFNRVHGGHGDGHRAGHKAPMCANCPPTVVNNIHIDGTPKLRHELAHNGLLQSALHGKDYSHGHHQGLDHLGHQVGHGAHGGLQHLVADELVQAAAHEVNGLGSAGLSAIGGTNQHGLKAGRKLAHGLESSHSYGHGHNHGYGQDHSYDHGYDHGHDHSYDFKRQGSLSAIDAANVALGHGANLGGLRHDLGHGTRHHGGHHGLDKYGHGHDVYSNGHQGHSGHSGHSGLTEYAGRTGHTGHIGHIGHIGDTGHNGFNGHNGHNSHNSHNGHNRHMGHTGYAGQHRQHGQQAHFGKYHGGAVDPNQGHLSGYDHGSGSYGGHLEGSVGHYNHQHGDYSHGEGNDYDNVMHYGQHHGASSHGVQRLGPACQGCSAQGSRRAKLVKSLLDKYPKHAHSGNPSHAPNHLNGKGKSRGGGREIVGKVMKGLIERL